MTITEPNGPDLPVLTPLGVDPELWPDIAVLPDRPLRAAIAGRLFRQAAKHLPLRVVEQGRRPYGRGGPTMSITRPGAFFQRLGDTGTIGFGEAYMAGDWTAEDLAGVIEAFAANMRDLIPGAFKKLRHAVLHRQPADEDNTVTGSRDNIRRHYDLSNAMFTQFLDPTMTYSSALFAGDPATSTEGLDEAQRRKIDRLLDVACVGPETRVLEIGTGWGELAIRAASRGAHVTSLTISSEQADLARRRIAAAGLSGRADVQLRDYRETTGEYDAVVSVEMIEAVGRPHWGTYFAAVDRLLAPGGRFGLQAILQPDDIVLATSETYTWIRKYIFPGGQLMSVEAIDRTLAQCTHLRVTDRLMFGQHYAETLRRWRDRFTEHHAEVRALGFDDVFARMWSLYLAYCEAGFRAGYLDVGQFAISKGG